MKTVIQKIGPLYGEAINGSVFGQPNGSEYVPSSNKVYLLKQDITPLYIRNDGNYVKTCTSAGSSGIGAYFASELQYSGKYYVKWELSNSSSFSSVLTSANEGSYMGSNNKLPMFIVGLTSALTVAAGTTYYVRACIVAVDMGQTNIVCYSDPVEVGGYA